MRKSRPLRSLFLALTLAASAAQAIEGSGYGPDPDEAQRRAAADLAATIQVRITSVVEHCTQVSNQTAEDCGSRVSNRTATDLPLLGLRYREIPGGNEPAGAKAILDAVESGPLYRDKLTSLAREFAAGSQALAAAKDRKTRHELLGRQLTTLRAHAEHRLVALALKLEVADLPASETALAAERAALEDTADSIPYAARLLLKGVSGRNAIVEPLAAPGSREATPLGVALADALRVESASHTGPKLAVNGEYRLRDDGDVDVVIEIRRELGRELISVRGVRLAKTAFAGLRAQPLAPDFEKLLRQGEAVSDEFRADLVTTVGSRTLKFKAGDTIKLAARLNRAGYFYVVGHVVRPDGQFSYLLPLQSTTGTDEAGRFIRYVAADQANHYVELGEFSVEPPFGTEHAQIIASTRSPRDSLPATRYDTLTGYYVINGTSGDARKGLLLTRGLKPKQNDKVLVTEGTLSFTTVEK